MRQQDKSAFLATLNGLAAMKPGAKLTPESLDLWWSSMQSWTIDEFKSAANHLVNSVEFFPNPYHFEQLRKANRMTSGEAFAMALESMHHSNPREWPSLSSGNPSVDAAVRAIGGYQQLAMCDTDKLGFLERRFAEHYETIGDAEHTREAVPLLTSWGEPKKKLDGPQPLRNALGNL